MQQGNQTKWLIFNEDDDFLNEKKDTGIPAVQEKMTMNLKDLDGSIEKYVKKNYQGFTLAEAYYYAEAYLIKAVKGDLSDNLIFDADENFVNKLAIAAPTTAVPSIVPAKADSLKTTVAPAKADTLKKK